MTGLALAPVPTWPSPPIPPEVVEQERALEDEEFDADAFRSRLGRLRRARKDARLRVSTPGRAS